ncbi:MAG: VWA domain-containing protein [Clostridia bacterium]|nr:VWA domain-containing protein [Clostridia bacterium]MBP5665067.1 VWA domain-containing protein [Clostridia bacterium]
MKNETVEKRNNITEMVFILDKSGSMAGLESDTIGGFNGMIAKQKGEEGVAYVTTVLFSNRSVTIHDRVPVENVPDLTRNEYSVGGCTALIDAIGQTVEHIETIHRYARPEDVPANTVFVITTDGLENASTKYSAKDVKKLVSKKREEGWEFIFLGANIDAVETARTYGIDESRAMNYKCDAAGTAVNFRALGKALKSIRRESELDLDCLAEIRDDYESRKD